jgi:hypothetical protein
MRSKPSVKTFAAFLITLFAVTGHADTTFHPDVRWDKMQLVSLQEAEQTLMKLEDAKLCIDADAERRETPSMNLGCIQGTSDGLLAAVQNATALYKNLSDAVILTKNCDQDPTPFIDRECVKGRARGGLATVRAAISDIQSRIGTGSPELTSCIQQRDYLRQQLHQLSSSNFNSIEKRTKELDDIISKMPKDAGTVGAGSTQSAPTK